MLSLRAITFSITLLTSSFLLFMVQPMIGRMLLPSLGGTPAVWNGCMLFFQAILLAGYAWAHYGPPRLGTRNHLLIHLALLGVVTLLLPMKLLTQWPVPTESNPLFWLLGQLTLCVGLPFFVISSSAPLLQRWFAESAETDNGGEPWFLYAVSNVGSLGALLLYPFVFERVMGLSGQGWFWTGGFLLLCILFSVCAAQTLGKPRLTLSRRQRIAGGNATTPAQPLTWKQRFEYIGLAAIPSSLMLGVTTIVSTEVGSFPMMWSIPLALYLLTFVFVFAKRQLIPHALVTKYLPMLLLFMPIICLVDMGTSPKVSLALYFGSFFFIAMFCHGEMAKRKPDVSQLTEFFLMMSIGGVCGGFLNSIVAPAVFYRITEFPLMLVAAAFALPAAKKTADDAAGKLATAARGISWTWALPVVSLVYVLLASPLFDALGVFNASVRVMAIFFPVMLVTFTLKEKPARFALCLAALALFAPRQQAGSETVLVKRGFFGVNEVLVNEKSKMRTLVNGITVHGKQRIDQMENPEPLTYYHKDGPIGDVFGVHGNAQKHVGLVGLGVGTVAAYCQPGQTFDYFEIDPAVVEIASNTDYFTYLATAKGDVNLILGDARLKLAERLRLQKHPITKSTITFSERVV